MSAEIEMAICVSCKGEHDAATAESDDWRHDARLKTDPPMWLCSKCQDARLRGQSGQTAVL
jgi:hypothetical protein